MAPVRGCAWFRRRRPRECIHARQEQKLVESVLSLGQRTGGGGVAGVHSAAVGIARPSEKRPAVVAVLFYQSAGELQCPHAGIVPGGPGRESKFWIFPDFPHPAAHHEFNMAHRQSRR